MGDNRDGSEDSRAFNTVGYIPAENIVGRADRVFYSVKPGQPWWQVWRWGQVMRGDRTFQSLYREPE
ncbi:MAG: S26 family signal peptidase, partial [Pseudomonadota bacterium]